MAVSLAIQVPILLLTSIGMFFSIHSDRLAQQLWQASRDGRDSEVLELLQRGVPPDSEYYQRTHDRKSPLWIACLWNHPLSAEYLIKWGASVTTVTMLGSTPLHVACANHRMDCVRILLEHHSPTG